MTRMVDVLLYPPKGKDRYEAVVDGHCYYVDKTPLLKAVFQDNSDQVLQITRPRRFGKSLTMSMFYAFLTINYKDPSDLSRHQELFSNRQIYKERDFCKNYMGKYPVLFLSLKSVSALDFKGALDMMVSIINSLADSLNFLQSSELLSLSDKEFFQKLLNLDYLQSREGISAIKLSLKKLTEFLFKHFNQKCILLIDEYDVPLAKASINNYYLQMVDLIRGMFEGALKSNDLNLEKAVLTGCLRVSKESIFTGLNNLSVNTFYSKDEDLATAIGFTEAETNTMLDYYGLGEYKKLVKENYDGYNFNNHELYCAWDVVCFCRDALKNKSTNTITADCFWSSTSSNELLTDFLGFLSPKDADDMQTLMDGGEISKKVRTDMNYEDLKKHRSDDFWSMLAYAGYLTVAGKSTFDVDNGPLPFKIPNLSIKKFFGNRIQEYFSDEIFSGNKGTTLTQAIFEGNAPKVKAVLREILQRYISVRDISAKIPKEYYYHALLNGYFSSQEDLIAQYSSNAEAGDGYTDIRFESMDGLKAVIIELKYADDPKLMSSLATKAIEQIEDKNYKDAYIGDDDTQILAYGICFSKKNCAVALKKLNNTES